MELAMQPAVPLAEIGKSEKANARAVLVG